MARQSQLKFATSKKDQPAKLAKPAKKSQNTARTRKLAKVVKEEVTTTKAGSVASASDGKVVSSSMRVPPFEWCQTYPGSVCSLSNFSPKTDGYWQMKIASWNVNGLRAWIKNGGLDYLQSEAPDVLCIQEIKCAKKDIPPLANIGEYTPHWYSANKPGYSGTGLYTKIKPLNVVYGLGISKHDTEGRIITAEYEHFYLINAYVPNSGQGLVRLDYRTKEWNKDLCKYIKKLDKEKPVILTGDLNVSHEEIDLANPAGNHRSAGFTDEERQGFSEMLADCDLVDTYRHFYPTRARAYTYWSARHNARKSNSGWRLDYFVVSRRMISSVVDQEIRCGILGSDHSALDYGPALVFIPGYEPIRAELTSGVTEQEGVALRTSQKRLSAGCQAIHCLKSTK
ncbi:DNA-(apurinic or apyrimidinic site) lyase [Echinococcus granulosus]|uniref:DNA-(apurinic or apyrimidinic site) endonuclease n=1 Tax=Echinococcus granulosus TaxID=6210 RepID=W6UR25_ECHGR|nr:DNA-(apurinic or apyrimidinic site) lyase [Echinococcus granulosus]EUB64165.1 DNA-(apurinic or apyrimidinic site) lyase [Echinococcus granulosus]